MIWLIIMIAGIGLTGVGVVGFILDTVTKRICDWGFVFFVIGIILCMFAVPFTVVGYIGYAENYNQYVTQYEYFNKHKDETLQNASLTVKKAELNAWLIDTQYWYKNYPIVSFADDKVMELELID